MNTMETGPVDPARVALRLSEAYAPVLKPSVALSADGREAGQRADRTTDRVEIGTRRVKSAKIEGLVAGKVAAGIDFDVVEAGAASESEQPIQLYKHPADKNVAATGVEAGRRLDVTG